MLVKRVYASHEHVVGVDIRQPYQELATLCPSLVFLTYRWLAGNTGIRPAHNVVPHSLLMPSQLRVAGCVVKALG